MQGASGRGVPEWLIASCGVWQIGLGLYFIFLRPALLPEDVRYMGADLHTVQAAVPRLSEWLGKVFTVMGGFMAGAGVLVAYFGLAAMPARRRGTAWALAMAGALTLGLMSAVNFALHSDFRWLLALPPAVWATAVFLHIKATRVN